MRVVVVGAGLMGSQIGCEYALGGHEVRFVARRREEAERRVLAAFALAREHELFPESRIDDAVGRVEVSSDLGPAADLVVESVVEDLAVKAEVLGEAARAFPGAVLASNTSSLSIGELGAAIAAPERTLGTHYWNPPLLMPLVEVVAGPGTDAAIVDHVTQVLRAVGKRPVLVERDVPGFVWNRLQLALLREALWLVEHGVATPETVDEVVTAGLARRWRQTGPFATVALGGAETFTRVAANLFPELSAAERADGLERWLVHDEGSLGELERRRNHALARELKQERDER